MNVWSVNSVEGPISIRMGPDQQKTERFNSTNVKHAEPLSQEKPLKRQNLG